MNELLIDNYGFVEHKEKRMLMIDREAGGNVK